MTMPEERTRAVIGTRDFLATLAAGEDIYSIVRSGFEGYESRLIHCQQGIGLGDKDVQQLFARQLELMFGQPDSLSSADALTPERPT